MRAQWKPPQKGGVVTICHLAAETRTTWTNKLVQFYFGSREVDHVPTAMSQIFVQLVETTASIDCADGGRNVRRRPESGDTSISMHQAAARPDEKWMFVVSITDGFYSKWMWRGNMRLVSTRSTSGHYSGSWWCHFTAKGDEIRPFRSSARINGRQSLHCDSCPLTSQVGRLLDLTAQLSTSYHRHTSI